MIGTALGHYRVLRKLGAGGMGEVYLAEDTRLGRQVALKVLTPELASDPEHLRRLESEARSLAALDHPNIVTLFSVEESSGVHFLTMAHIEGQTLADEIPPGGLPLDRCLDLALPLADALRSAHERGVIHRDLKPANIMLDREHHLRILDFGLAKKTLPDVEEGLSKLATEGVTKPGLVLGTLPYMAPEQLRGEATDHRSDIFSLGVILYEMATGSRPFHGATPVDLTSSILRETPPSVIEMKEGLPKQLDRIIRHCLEKDPRRRFQSALDIHNELLDLRQEISAESRPAAARTKELTRPGSRLVRPLVAAAVIIGLGIVALTLRGRQGEEVPAASSAQVERNSIAILRFQNLAGDPELDWLRTGLADLMVTQLSQSPDLRVLGTDRLLTLLEEMGRTEESIASFELVRELAERARVATVVLGSFTRAGDLFRLSIKLEEAASGRILVSRQVEGTGESSLFSLVDQLSAEVRALFGGGELVHPLFDPELETVTTSSLAAYRNYAAGMELYRRHAKREAAPHFEKAVAVDPEFALAWARLANSTSDSTRSEEFAKRAIENAGRLPPRERFYLEGLYANQAQRFDIAEAAYRKAVESYPDHGAARHNLANLYLLVERYDDALEHFQVNVQSGYPGILTYTHPALAHRGRGSLAKSRELLERLALRHPESWFVQFLLGETLMAAGDLDAALTALDVAEALQPEDSRPKLSAWRLRVLRSEPGEAERVAREMASGGAAELRPAGLLSQALGALYQGRLHGPAAILEEAARIRVGGLYQREADRRAAELLLLSGRPEEAVARVAAAPGGGEPLLRRRGLLVIEGLAQTRLGRSEEVHRIVELLDQDTQTLASPAFKRAQHWLRGELALAVEDPARAIQELSSAAELLPGGVLAGGTAASDHVPVWFSLAVAHLAAGDRSSATEWLQRIVDSTVERVDHPVYYVRSFYFLGKTYGELGDLERSRAAYRRFAEHWEGGELDRERVAEALAAASSHN